jgi:MFS family permease
VQTPDQSLPESKAAIALWPVERRAVAALAAIYAARMLGLFLLLPVLALYVGALPGARPWQMGVALGAYGLTQAALQIPFGRWSDRFGRRLLITVGLVLYALGSVIGGLSSTISGVILARLVQGAGAVSGPVTALLADLTRAGVRTRAMAVIGISIGGSFMVSLVAAPLLGALIGVQGLFWVMAALAVLCLALLWGVVPTPRPVEQAPAASVTAVFRRDLMPYYTGVFMLHVVLTLTFFGVPYALRDQLGVVAADQWKTYLGVFLASILPTIPLVLLTERVRAPIQLMRVAATLLAASLAGLMWGHGHYGVLCTALIGFFVAFNYLESRLPARLSQVAGAESRGAALGVFATAQFLGAFVGGVTAAGCYAIAGLTGVFAAGVCVAAGWGVWVWRAAND